MIICLTDTSRTQGGSSEEKIQLASDGYSFWGLYYIIITIIIIIIIIIMLFISIISNNTE